MTPATLPVDSRATTSSAEDGELEVRSDATETSVRKQRVPLIMPSEQEYFWHFEWQQGEREAAAERDTGKVVRFDSDDPEDIVRWLHESDGDN
jgi:hypothetical protein